MRFPVLVSYGRAAEITFFHLRPRPRRGFVLADSLALNLAGTSSFLSDFLLWSQRFFPRAVNFQVEWPAAEREKLRADLKLPREGYLVGNSWTLPLFLAFDRLFQGRPWPEGLLASGAVRRVRGLRCVSVGGARFKLRRAKAGGCRLLLPRSNVRALSRRGLEVSDCLPLPPNLAECLRLWRSY